jgi:hypothetical protein
MTLQEAIRSGKPFKRKDWLIYYQPGAQVFLDAELILATDWEVEEEKLVVTEYELLYAYDLGVREGLLQARKGPIEYEDLVYSKNPLNSFIKGLKKNNLGFKE